MFFKLTLRNKKDSQVEFECAVFHIQVDQLPKHVISKSPYSHVHVLGQMKLMKIHQGAITHDFVVQQLNWRTLTFKESVIYLSNKTKLHFVQLHAVL